MAKKTYPKKRIKKVVIRPCWYLSLKGRIDSRKGENVCNSYLNQIFDKLPAYESVEAEQLENALKSDREQALAALDKISEIKIKLSALERALTETTDEVERRRQRNKYNSCRSELSSTKAYLPKIYENIVSLETIYAERINHMRSHAVHKVDAYITGVRHRIPGYNFDTRFSDVAFECYKEKNGPVDNQLLHIFE